MSGLRGTGTRPMFRRARGIVGTTAHAAAFVLLAACATNPVTGERELSLVSESQEIQLGRQAADAAVRQLGLVDDAALQAYVEGLGMRIAQGSERPDLPWTFGVVDDPVPNAFAAPGGYVFVTRGMLTLMRNEAELFGVLGHEVGHVTARHSAQMLSRAQLAQIGLGIGSMISSTIAALGDLAGAGLQLLFLRYGRDAEHQADDLGFRYALENGYDPRYMANMFVSLQRLGEASGESPVPAWMSTHPYPAERIERIRAQAAQTPLPPGARAGVDEYLAHIDGLVYGENPRNGFFSDNVFAHPDMRFVISFPQGWRTQNAAQAVMAGSPQQDGLMQLALADGGPQQAAAQFFSQAGVTAAGVTETAVNGLPAVIGRFNAATAQGALAGVAAFIAHDAHTFAVLGLAPAARFAQHEPAFVTTIGSFNRLADPRALEVQPQRIAVTPAPRAMTLAEFDAQFPSGIELDELALINQLEGPQATMPAGYAVKRVVGTRPH